ncbi:MAG: DUF5667 domain-containing protein [Candidatus Levybacteria bacterium]|nr:DUF5667 domain-containing protein [Candidatus Levybacteria bacterium]
MKLRIFIAIIIIFIFFPQVVFAETMSLKEIPLSPSPKQAIGYELAYPGLLPDSPLYFLKVARDKAISLLTSDPLKKAEFDLLTSDKRLNSAVYLFKKGANKYVLAEQTISKGENYFEDAIKQVELAKTQGLSVSDTLSNLYLASQKHEEVIKSLVNQTSGGIKDNLIIDEKRVQGLQQKVNALMSK